MPRNGARSAAAGRSFFSLNPSVTVMSDLSALTRCERCLTLLTRVQPGDGRRIGILALQAFTLMVGYYLIRPVREALILTEGTAELRSYAVARSEEHTSELQSQSNLVCRLLLEKKKEDNT